MVKLGKKPSKTRRYRDLIDGPLKNRRSMAIASSRVRLFRLFFMKKNFYFSVSFSFFDSSDAVRRVALCFVVFFYFAFVFFSFFLFVFLYFRDETGRRRRCHPSRRSEFIAAIHQVLRPQPPPLTKKNKTKQETNHPSAGTDLASLVKTPR